MTSMQWRLHCYFLWCWWYTLPELLGREGDEKFSSWINLRYHNFYLSKSTFIINYSQKTKQLKRAKTGIRFHEQSRPYHQRLKSLTWLEGWEPIDRFKPYNSRFKKVPGIPLVVLKVSTDKSYMLIYMRVHNKVPGDQLPTAKTYICTVAYVSRPIYRRYTQYTRPIYSRTRSPHSTEAFLGLATPSSHLLSPLWTENTFLFYPWCL